ncbi:unnamed protein product [Vicia faba]|uniref:Uncharacterized protein n=1 Tax=Vicia faba TaxID=3906 RepID=A0AAV0ZUE8_VICFA|nr:unnamed protein product [Vicia faba]
MQSKMEWRKRYIKFEFRDKIESVQLGLKQIVSDLPLGLAVVDENRDLLFLSSMPIRNLEKGAEAGVRALVVAALRVRRSELSLRFTFRQMGLDLLPPSFKELIRDKRRALETTKRLVPYTTTRPTRVPTHTLTKAPTTPTVAAVIANSV